MKVFTKEQLMAGTQGSMMMLYGPTGVGKTVSILQTATCPIAYIQTEPRDLSKSIQAANRPDLEIEAFLYESCQDLVDFLSKPADIERFSTITVDSYSYLMAISLSAEIEDEAYEARTQKEKSTKPLTAQTKLSLEGFGGLNSWMFRITDLLARYSQAGKVVIVTALLAENPKWNRDLAAAPALKGREFPTNMPGFFDFIGLVQSRQDSHGKILYPPNVFFDSPDGAFTAKFTGVGSKRQGSLNIEKILNQEG